MSEAASLFAFPPTTTDQQHIQAKQEIKDNTHVKTEPIDNITIPTAANEIASIPTATTATTAAPTSPSPSTTSTPVSSSSSASVSPRSRSRPSHAIMSRMRRPAHGGHTSRITLLRRQRNHVLLATITVARLAKMKADLRVRQLARRAQHPPSPAPLTTTMPASKFTRPYPSSSNTFAPHLFTPFGKLRASALSAPVTPFTTTNAPFPISSTLFPSNLPLSRSFSLPQRRSPTLGSATSYRMPSPTSLLTHAHTRTPPSSSPLLRSLPSTQPSIFAHTSTLLHGRSSLSYLPPRTSLSPSTPSPSKPAYLGGSFRVNTTPSPPSTSTSTSPATSPSLSPSDRRPSAAILGGSHIYNITSASSSTTAAPSTSSTFAVPQMVTRRTAKAVTESKVNGVEAEAEAPTTVRATSITTAASRRRPNKVSILHHPMHGNRISAKQTKILQELPITTSAVAPRKWDPAESALRASIPMTRGRANLTRHTRSPHLPPSHPATTINSNLHLLSSQVV